MTSAELKLFSVIEAAVPEYRVFGQVAMGALLKVRGGLDGADAMSVRGRFAQKIVNFVIFDPRSGEVVAIVELDDASHNAERMLVATPC